MKTALERPPPAAKARVLRRSRALTMVELLVVVAVLAVVAVMFLPRFFAVRRPASRLSCVNNLKQVGLAFRMFATDNDDKFPPLLSTNQGGVEELVNIGPGGAGDATRTFWIFVAMSNELTTPVLVCPADRNRAAISNFFGMARGTALAQGGQNASLS